MLSPPPRRLSAFPLPFVVRSSCPPPPKIEATAFEKKRSVGAEGGATFASVVRRGGRGGRGALGQLEFHSPALHGKSSSGLSFQVPWRGNTVCWRSSGGHGKGRNKGVPFFSTPPWLVAYSRQTEPVCVRTKQWFEKFGSFRHFNSNCALP